MHKDQLKGQTKQAKDKVREISGKLFRDKLLENKGRAQKIGGRIQAGYGDFREDLQGYGDFRDDFQKSG